MELLEPPCAERRALEALFRGCTKVRRRDTTEAAVGAATGTLTRPQLLALGRHDAAAGCVPSAAQSPCVRTPPGRSPST
ncbi:hypothetical protein ACIO7M_12285 [Streptomyces toxytricini]|uniref:Uncharacterized protein n=1 Tax=Streptomyces toxytricini TaxID=67369 RepID=A0ABW8EF63_STRT5